MLFLMSKKELKRYKNSKLKNFRRSKRQWPLKKKTEIREAENKLEGPSFWPTKWSYLKDIETEKDEARGDSEEKKSNSSTPLM